MPSYNHHYINSEESIMKFCHYMKLCREHFDLTQEELVQHLYIHDNVFSKLDVGTLSRWERGITCPNLERQAKFIESLRTFSDTLFPGFEFFDIEKIKLHTSQSDISKTIGKHKRYILDFPKDLIEIDKIRIHNMKEARDFNSSLKLTYELHKKITNNYSNLTLEQFQLWA